MMNSYTSQLAYHPTRYQKRTTLQFCLLNLFPKSVLFQRALGYLSILSGVSITSFMMIGSTCLIPSILVSKYFFGWPSFFNQKVAIASGADSASNNVSKTAPNNAANASTTHAGSTTALKVLSARSQMSLQKSGGPDFLAPLLMRRLSLLGPNIPGSNSFSRMYLLLARWNFYVTGRIFSDQATEYAMGKWVKFGEAGLLQARTCWLDDVVDSFVAKRERDEAFNVVILGAGYDTRCYRLESLKKKEGSARNARLFEVDASGTQKMKIDALNGAKIDSSNVTFVSCDFEREDWFDALQSQATQSTQSSQSTSSPSSSSTISTFDKKLPTLFVWEGVSYYLDRDIVTSTIAKVAQCGKGSCIAFDYFNEAMINPVMIKSSTSAGEPLKFGVDFDGVDELVGDCNKLAEKVESEESSPAEGGRLQVWDHLQYEEMRARYLAKCADGRCVGYLEDFGGFLLVGK